MSRIVVVLLALFLPMLAGAATEKVTSDDAVEIRAVIHRQIEAFRRDDAQGAFALVTPSVRQAFHTPEKFMDVVRMAYRAMVRPATVVFLDMLVMGGEVVQPVQLTDRAGSVWVAYYSMQRQRDGSWRTNGCHLAQAVRSYPA
ncbi:MAG: DUF4864 domain-containing protein [Clostridia bacterium]